MRRRGVDVCLRGECEEHTTSNIRVALLNSAMKTLAIFGVPLYLIRGMKSLAIMPKHQAFSLAGEIVLEIPVLQLDDHCGGALHPTAEEDDISPAWRGGQFVFHHEVTATAHLKVKAAKRRMRDDVSKDRKRCAPSSALRWCRPASLALEIVN